MEHRERADEVEKDIDRLEQESEQLGENTAQARSEWEAAKSDPSKAPGATTPESSGPHHIDAEDPATGEKYGDRRGEEIDEVRAEDAEAAEDDDPQQDGDNDST